MKPKKILTLIAVAALLGVSLLYAQDDGAPRQDPATTPQRGVDVSTAVTLEGAVISYQNQAGKPSTLVVDDADMGKTVVRLGPGWYLDGIGFTAAAGESVKVTAGQCSECTAGHIAIRVENLATGAVAELRDESGRPVWRGSGARAGAGAGSGGRHGRGGGCGGQGWAEAGDGQRGGMGCCGGCGRGRGGMGCGRGRHAQG